MNQQAAIAEWQEVAGSWVLVPLRQVGIIHFLGGAFVATAPQLTYRRLLEALSRQGYVVIATPFINTFDHREIAERVLYGFERTLDRLQINGYLRRQYLPIYGLGHSMGCKLHLLIGSLFAVERAGNILMAFNNYNAKDAIPLMREAMPMMKDLDMSLEFTPTPAETNTLVTEHYRVQRNLLVRFADDTIDQSPIIHQILDSRFSSMVTLVTLRGNHLTPLGSDVNWKVGNMFSPIDAIGQWVKQSFYQELNQLQAEILRWLDPFSPIAYTR